MPLYEYHCNSCQRRVTILVRSFTEPSSLSCPECGSDDLSRRFSSFAIRLAGKIYREEIQEDIAEIQQEEWGKSHPEK